jgi:hypothetical protein
MKRTRKKTQLCRVSVIFDRSPHLRILISGCFLLHSKTQVESVGEEEEMATGVMLIAILAQTFPRPAEDVIICPHCINYRGPIGVFAFAIVVFTISPFVTWKCGISQFVS